MSGHSKWANIKHRKEAMDKKRAQLFAKLSRAISIAAKNESNPDFNPTLRTVIEKARKLNMPQNNIEKAIKKSSEVKNLNELIIEGYGPEGIAIIVQATTDNRNRTISEIKKIFKDNGIKWAEPGSVLWAFKNEYGDYIAKFPQKISEDSKEKLIAIINNLEDNDDVVDIYDNADIDEG